MAELQRVGRYESLQPVLIADTAERLHDRIEARFAGRGLAALSQELVTAVHRAGDDARTAARPVTWLRIAIWTVVIALAALVILGLATALDDAIRDAGSLSSFDWLGVAESAVNDLVFGGIAIFFLFSIEGRRKRAIMLAALHRLRSMAHVVDMHQLTKDPERLLSKITLTSASVPPDLSPDLLGRYLEHCSELLSIIGKTAAVYAQSTTDGQVLATVNEIENLTVGLSRKVWQKISLLHR